MQIDHHHYIVAARIVIYLNLATHTQLIHNLMYIYTYISTTNTKNQLLIDIIIWIMRGLSYSFYSLSNLHAIISALLYFLLLSPPLFPIIPIIIISHSQSIFVLLLRDYTHIWSGFLSASARIHISIYIYICVDDAYLYTYV